MTPTRVLVAGARGRMGRVVCAAVRTAPDLELVGEVDLGDDLGSAIRAAQARVVVDFTTPAAVAANVEAIVDAKAQGVIGTTGIPPARMDEFAAWAAQAGCGLLIAPNFALGMVLLQRFARAAARHLSRVEIVESHHEAKLDAPSGTALATAHALGAAGARPGPHSGHPARGVDVAGVQVHSLRLPGLHASMEVRLGAEHETLRLAHDALSRECYVPGVLLAIRAMADGRAGLVRGLEPLLFGDGA